MASARGAPDKLVLQLRTPLWSRSQHSGYDFNDITLTGDGQSTGVINTPNMNLSSASNLTIELDYKSINNANLKLSFANNISITVEPSGSRRLLWSERRRFPIRCTRLRRLPDDRGQHQPSQCGIRRSPSSNAQYPRGFEQLRWCVIQKTQFSAFQVGVDQNTWSGTSTMTGVNFNQAVFPSGYLFAGVELQNVTFNNASLSSSIIVPGALSSGTFGTPVDNTSDASPDLFLTTTPFHTVSFIGATLKNTVLRESI